MATKLILAIEKDLLAKINQHIEAYNEAIKNFKNDNKMYDYIRARNRMEKLKELLKNEQLKESKL